MKLGHVPLKEVGPVVAELILDRWPDGGGIDVLAEMVGCDYSTIENLVKQTNEGMDFDIVDRVFCALGRVDIWHGRLADVYQAIDLGWCKCEGPHCTKPFRQTRDSGPNLRRYCSESCKSHASQVERGIRSGEHLRKRGLCLKGHKISGDNIKRERNGVRCRICKQENDRNPKRRRRELALAEAAA